MITNNLGKVLFVHDGPMYFDNIGNIYGIHYNDKIVDRYYQLGEHVTFLMRKKPLGSEVSSSLSKITRNNFSFVPIPEFKSIKTYFFNKPKAKRIIQDSLAQNDILVVRMPSAAGALAIAEAKKLKKPYLIEMVACTFDAYWNYNWKGKLIAHYKKWKVQRIIAKCPYVIYVTEHFLQNRYPTEGKQINISNVELKPINQDDFVNRLEKIKNRNPHNPLVFGTVAAIDVPYKGQDDVIRAIGKLKRQGLMIQYHMVGQGNPSRLQSIINDEGLESEVKICGPMKHEAVFDFLKKIDVYIQPSKQEGLPRALIEAMSVACPALGARTAGIPELLDSDCIFQPGNIDQICEKIIRIEYEWMLAKASKNFEKSKAYAKDVLESRRTEFYNMFLEDLS